MSKISIIVPCHNVEKYLPKCLESLMGQTFCDIDIVVVENGSTDGTLEVLRQYAAKDPRIMVLTSDIPSIQAARNMGIKASSGEYIMFCDSDDWFAPDMCEVMYKAITKSGADVACCNVTLEYAEDLSEEEKRIRDYTEYYKLKKTGLHKLNNRIIMKTSVVVWNKIMRRSIVEKILPFYKTVRVHEDNLLWYLYSLNADSVFFVKNSLYHYLLRPGSIMSEVALKTCDSSVKMNRILVINHVLDYLKSLQNPTKKEQELAVTICEYMLREASKQLNDKERQEVCNSINERVMATLRTEVFFIPADADIMNVHDNHPLPLLMWKGLMLRTRRTFNLLRGKKVSGNLKRKILLNEMKIKYKKDSCNHNSGTQTSF